MPKSNPFSLATTQAAFSFSSIVPLLTAAVFTLAVPAPALAQLVVLSPATQELDVEAGDVRDGRIRVRNAGGEPAELRVGQSDYSFHADGTSRFGNAGSLPRSNASWIVPSPAEMILAPGEEAEVAYRVSVPDGPDRLQGTYWSVIFLEWIPAGDPESRLGAGEADPRVTLRTRIRHAIQVATHVGAGGETLLAFEKPALTRDGEGGVEFEVVVQNQGTTGYRPRISTALFDAAGREVRADEEQRGLLYPETSLEQRFHLGNLPSGEYTVLLLADAGGDQVFGAQYSLRF